MKMSRDLKTERLSPELMNSPDLSNACEKDCMVRKEDLLGTSVSANTVRKLSDRITTPSFLDSRSYPLPKLIKLFVVAGLAVLYRCLSAIIVLLLIVLSIALWTSCSPASMLRLKIDLNYGAPKDSVEFFSPVLPEYTGLSRATLLTDFRKDIVVDSLVIGSLKYSPMSNAGVIHWNIPHVKKLISVNKNENGSLLSRVLEKRICCFLRTPFIEKVPIIRYPENWRVIRTSLVQDNNK